MSEGQRNPPNRTWIFHDHCILRHIYLKDSWKKLTEHTRYTPLNTDVIFILSLCLPLRSISSLLYSLVLYLSTILLLVTSLGRMCLLPFSQEKFNLALGCFWNPSSSTDIDINAFAHQCFKAKILYLILFLTASPNEGNQPKDRWKSGLTLSTQLNSGDILYCSLSSRVSLI